MRSNENDSMSEDVYGLFKNVRNNSSDRHGEFSQCEEFQSSGLILILIFRIPCFLN